MNPLLQLRHIILSAIASIISISAQAEIHLEAGMGISGIKSIYPETGSRLGSFCGVGYNTNIGKTLILDPMLQLSLQGKDTYGILYAKLPVILYVKAANFDIGVGLYAGYAIKYEHHEIDILDEPEPGSFWYPDFEYASSYFKPFDAGAIFKIRYNFSRFYLGIEESYGLRDIGKYHRSGVYEDYDFHGHNFLVNFCVGIKF